MDPIEVGIVGCGTISDAYLSADDRFDSYRITACADLEVERAREKAREYGVDAYDPDALYEESDVEAVVNLTPPAAHATVIERALEEGRHVYTEKPFAVTPDEAERILATAEREGLRVGAAPDTFLGAGLQTARAALDDGRIGRPVAATAAWTSPGHEHWHPEPAFFYGRGGGPLFDMGPYYLTALVALLGPAGRVAGATTRASDERTITSEPHRGERVDVEVPTHETGVVDFRDGPVATVLTSFDAQSSALPSPAFEIYGTEATMWLPDPNHFEGPVRVRGREDEEWERLELTHDYTAGRGAGVADLARAIRDDDWDHRTSGALGAHVLDLMDGLRSSATDGDARSLETDLERPAPLPAGFPAD